MLGARFWKIARLLGGIAIILGLAQFVRAKTPEPFLQVGAVQKQFATDALCTLVYRHQIIWIDAQDEVWMNLEGRDERLLPQAAKSPKISSFKAGDRLIHIQWGISEAVPAPGKMGMDGTIYKNAKITITKGAQSFTLPVTGGCDGGANWGATQQKGAPERSLKLVLN